MENDVRLNLEARDKAEGLFVKKECDKTLPHVQAAIISAASNMAIAGKFAESGVEPVTPEMVIEELLRAYQAKGVEAVESLLNMTPNYVKDAIGYSVDFTDLSRATVAYEAQAPEYDSFYGTVRASYEANKEKETEKHM